MSNTSKLGIFGGVTVFAIAAVLILFNPEPTVADNDLPVVTVYKSPTCGCCRKWVKHMESNGFKVISKNLKNLDSIKKRFGIKRSFQSCHTAKIGNYVVEGHVPAEDVKRLLKQKSAIDGLAVPGMPMGSPGMEGHRKDNYEVLAINKGDVTGVFAKH